MPSRGVVRASVEGLAILGAIAGLGFGVQAAVLKRPSHAQLIAVQALQRLSNYHVMQSTEQIGGRDFQSLCFEHLVLDRKTHGSALGSFVLVGRSQRYYDLGHGVRRVGREAATQAAARARFRLAGCPGFLERKLGTLLVDWHPVEASPVSADGVAAYRIHFGRVHSGIELYAMRRGFRPLAIALGAGPSAPSADLEPLAPRAQATLVELIVPENLDRRFLNG